MLRRNPNPKHPTVELSEFLNHWKVSHAELAQICECNVSTVGQWFLSPDDVNYCPPTEHDKQLLAQAHYLWRTEAFKERTERLRQMYWQKHSQGGGK